LIRKLGKYIFFVVAVVWETAIVKNPREREREGERESGLNDCLKTGEKDKWYSYTAKSSDIKRGISATDN
jgi:hypothetical protein